MNENIKTGASLIADGIREEANGIKNKIDRNGDGKIESEDISESVKTIAGKLSKLLSNKELPEKVKGEIKEVTDKIDSLVPQIEAKRMEAEIAKERIKAEIKHAEEIQKIKDEVL